MPTAIVIPSETQGQAALSEALRRVSALESLPAGWNGHDERMNSLAERRSAPG